ncbi:hypothetical protein [Glycomyces xiaoerkulensis]|uniref:hypothetical protein n=1 Tax=Glycomyces xiaoerkulensis TaxID=2038139 RepID=UPI000C259436|nr:hypothetical protein [Glycomyces xiaoerkulensis]
MSYPQQPHYNMGDYPTPGGSPPPYSPQPTNPYAPPPPPQQRPSFSSATPLLVTGLVAAVAVAGLMLTLWLLASGDLSDAEDLADERADAIEELESDKSDLEDQLGQAEEHSAELESQVSDFESEVGEMSTVQGCIDGLEAFFDTEIDSDEEAEAWDEMVDLCEDWVY